MEPIVFGIAALSFVVVVTSLLGARTWLVTRRGEVLARMARLTHREEAAAHREPPRWAAFIAELMPQGGAHSPMTERLRRRLIHAGFRQSSALAYLITVKLALAVLLALLTLSLGALLRPSASGLQAHLPVLLLAGAGFLLPNAWLARRAQQRQTELGRALPDALDLLVTSVEAGLGLEAAFVRIAAELDLASPALATELRQTVGEIQAGVARGEAFRRLADRTGLEELRALAVTFVQSEMFGTSIARALRLHVTALREQRTRQAEERAATLSVKLLIPLILCILPSLLVIIAGPAVVRIVRILLPALEGK